jgi:xylose isomerase
LAKKFRKIQALNFMGTCNLFSHPRFMAGAGTNPSPEVFAFATAKVKKALEITHELDGAG